jgi:hypothetical protein
MGETVLHWVLFLDDEGDDKRQLLNDLACEMLDESDESAKLMKEPFQKEPFAGQTPLMQAVANGNEKFVELLLKRADESDVNHEATGHFILSKVACPLHSIKAGKDVSVLEVAAIAPLDDDVSVRLVKRLLDARANVNASENGDASLLGRLASCAWRRGQERGELVPKKRVRDLVQLAVKHMCHNQDQLLTPRTMELAGRPSGAKDRHTPLQEAAVAGHDNFIISYLMLQQQIVWQWGHRRQVCIPLREIDHEPDDNDADILELLVLHKHRDSLCTVLLAEIIKQKWEQFGCAHVKRELYIMIFVVATVTVACLPKSLKLEGATRPLRLAALVLTTVLLCIRTRIHNRAAESSEFFQKMHYFGTEHRLGYDDCRQSACLRQPRL